LALQAIIIITELLLFRIFMDVIVFGDFLITNADGKTTFQFRTPSEGGVEL